MQLEYYSCSRLPGKRNVRKQFSAQKSSASKRIKIHGVTLASKTLEWTKAFEAQYSEPQSLIKTTTCAFQHRLPLMDYCAGSKVILGKSPTCGRSLLATADIAAKDQLLSFPLQSACQVTEVALAAKMQCNY